MIKQICISLLLISFTSAQTIKDIVALFGTESTKATVRQIQMDKYPYLSDVDVKMYAKSIVEIKLSTEYFIPGDTTHKKQKDLLEKELFKHWGQADTTKNTDQKLSFIWLLEKGDTITFNVNRRKMNEDDSLFLMYNYNIKIHNRKKLMNLMRKSSAKDYENYKNTSVKGSRSFTDFHKTIVTCFTDFQGVYYYYMKEKRRTKPAYTLKGTIHARFTVKSSGELISVHALKSDFPDDLNHKLIEQMSKITFSSLPDKNDTSTFDYRLSFVPNDVEYYERMYISKKK